MKKLQNTTEWMGNFNYHLKSLKPYRAVMRTFSTIFPFVLLGSIMKYLQRSFFTKEGFFSNIYRLQDWFPFYKEIGIMFNSLALVTVSATTLIATFFAAKNLAKNLHDDADIVGVCGLVVTFLLNFNYNLTDFSTNDNRSLVYFENFDFRYIFIGVLTGLVIAYLFHGLVWLQRMIWWRNHHDRIFIGRSIQTIFPVVIILIGVTFFSFWLNMSSQKTITNLLSGLINQPVSKFKHTMFFIYFISFISCIFSFVGLSIANVSLSNGINTSAGSANLNYALVHKNLFKVPNPISLHTMYETYGHFGGTGLTLGLVIAILLVARNHRLREVALYSLIPTGLGSINAPLMVGIPVLFNPVLLIPFLISPLVSMTIAWLFINFKLMPPVVYAIPTTTPSLLQGFLGTNGNFMALFVSFLCLAAATAIYYPFVKVLDQSYELSRKK